MSAADPVIEFSRQWWSRAVEDLEAAKAARHLPTASCFHSQQAVEKAIKTLLVVQQIEFEKTHDIGELLAILSHGRTPVPNAMKGYLTSLTRFAVETRYPPEAASPQEATEALDAAEEFLLWARQQLPKEV
jgi:HEPN domain-containing protein